MTNDIENYIDTEQWDKVLELISRNKDLFSSIDPYHLAWSRFRYQIAENGVEELVYPHGKLDDIIQVVEVCKKQGMIGSTIPQATAFQQLDQIQMLIDNGHKIDELDFGERTGLMVASALNDFKLVEYFLNNGSMAILEDQDHYEAIDYTVLQEIIDILKQHKGTTKQEKAEAYDEYCIAREKLNNHREANLNFIKAAKKGDINQMQDTLTNNEMPFITIDFVDYESGNTALHYAVNNNDKKAIDFLLSNKIDVTKKNRQGITAFELAKMLGNEQLFNNDDK